VAKSPQSQRLAWLDALRGIAALAVVFDHLSQYLLKGLRDHVYHWIDTGRYGVFIFFLISGYIVPASLERKGSVRTFWVSRAFRLYPMYVIAIGLALLLWEFDHGHGPGNDPANVALSMLLMLGNVLDGPNLPNVIWSLSLEMVFYLVLTALFVARVHRRSSWYALAFGAGAVAFGGMLQQNYLSGKLLTPHLVAATADVIIIAGLAAAIALRGIPRLLGASVVGLLAVALVAFNTGWPYPWETLAILGLMFTGTTIYRADQGQYPWPRAIAAAVATIGLAITAGIWHSHAWHIYGPAETLWERRYFFAFTLAGLTFAAGLLCRNMRIPKWITWLGLISYSVYLVHPLLIEVYFRSPLERHHWSSGMQLVMFISFALVTVAVSSVTYLLVEKPMQDLGRKVAKWLDGRFGPDRMPDLVPGGPQVPLRQPAHADG
jgi:peptidoglycan/LPS O-acetylase OafA/YrhL